jgi:hypothetical protein
MKRRGAGMLRWVGREWREEEWWCKIDIACRVERLGIHQQRTCKPRSQKHEM